MTKLTFYKGYRLQIMRCRVHNLFHAYINNMPLRAAAEDEAGGIHTGTIGFASVEAALDLAKETIDGSSIGKNLHWKIE